MKMVGEEWMVYFVVASVFVPVHCEKLYTLSAIEDDVFNEEIFDLKSESDNIGVNDNRLWAEKHKCPPSEEYLTCGPTCQVSCDTIGVACPPGPCVEGCFCKDGKVRSPRGNCISQRHCKSKLPLPRHTI